MIVSEYYRVKTKNGINGTSNRATEEQISYPKLGALIDSISTIVERISSTLSETVEST